MQEIRGIGIPTSCIDKFANCLSVEPKEITGGFFYSNKSGYRERIANYLGNILSKNIKEHKQFLEELFKFLELSNDFQNKSQNQKLKVYYNLEEVQNRNFAAIYSIIKSLFKNVSDENCLIFNRYKKDEYFKVVNGEVNKQYKHPCLAMLKVTTDKILDINSNGDKTNEMFFLPLYLKMFIRKELANMLIKYIDNKKEKKTGTIITIKEYLQNVKNIYEELKLSEYFEQKSEYDTNLWLLKKESIRKILDYLFPFHFIVFQNNILLSRAGLFFKKKTPDELLKEIEEIKDNTWNDFCYLIGSQGEETEGKIIDGENKIKKLIYLISDKNFLQQLRKEWKNFLKELNIQKENKYKTGQTYITTAFVTPNQKSENSILEMEYGKFKIPLARDKEMQILIYYEDGKNDENDTDSLTQEKIFNFAKEMKRTIENKMGQYLGNLKINIDKQQIKPIKELIYNFDEIKKFDYSKDTLEQEDSKKLLSSLISFACTLKNFAENLKRKDNIQSIWIILNTEEKNYPFWNFFKMLYYFWGIPIQTIDKKSVKQFLESKKISFCKNLIISMFKETKKNNMHLQRLEYKY